MYMRILYHEVSLLLRGWGGGAVNKYKVIAKREETPEENRKSEPVSTIINQKASVRHFCTLKALTVACQDRTN